MDDVRVIFVLPEQCNDPSTAPQIMVQAHKCCEENDVNVMWVKDASFHAMDLAKTDFVVFHEFKGRNFDSLNEKKCARILGPWCLFTCLMEGKPIPNYPWPIYNTAMRDCIITCSFLPKNIKHEIKHKVQMMGGCYNDNLMTTSTHLITETVKSEKYLQAAESNIKVMTAKWVETVWNASQDKSIHCNDEVFSKYRCPPFHKLTISSTGFPNVSMRQELSQKIASNGGIFTASLSLATTDVLVVFGVDGAMSQKYKAARSNAHINCVSIDWVDDSIEKGYALSHQLYRVQKGTSTPTREDNQCPDFSILSAIGNTTKRSTVEETMMFSMRRSPQKRKATQDTLNDLIDDLDIKKVKTAGQFLDGYMIMLVGFNQVQKEKLYRILNLSGATRYDEIEVGLTHIIVGDKTSPELKALRSRNLPASLVSIYWLLESLDNQRAVDEENFLMSLQELDKVSFASPLSQKGLSLLRSQRISTSEALRAINLGADDDCGEEEQSLVQQYFKPSSRDQSDTLMEFLAAEGNLKPTEAAPKAVESTISIVSNSKGKRIQEVSKHDLTLIPAEATVADVLSQKNNIFRSKKFVIQGFDAEETANLKERIEGDLGIVMTKSFKGIIDYLVVPVVTSFINPVSALTTVNNLWVMESIEDGEEKPLEYYHETVVSKGTNTLQNCVITSSGYSTFEKYFMKSLIEESGGVYQYEFARIHSVAKNIQASTHLLSLEASGKKYNAALKWGLPIVKKEWLIESVKAGKRLPENDFFINKTLVECSPRPLMVEKLKQDPDATGSKTGTTPKALKHNLSFSRLEHTPQFRRLSKIDDGDCCSQVTPVSKLMEEARKTNLFGTPQTPGSEVKLVGDIATPESPFGCFIRPHLSPKSKKELMGMIQCRRDYVPPPPRRKSTPLSEVKRRCWAKLMGSQVDQPEVTPSKTLNESSGLRKQLQLNDDSEESENEKLEEMSSQNVFVNTKLREIQEMANAMSAGRRVSRPFEITVPPEVANRADKDTQPCTVGWDYSEEKQRIFILSGFSDDMRRTIIEQIESLGAHVSDLQTFDPNCTHLICAKPARNEKTLSCTAGGRWILHVSYVQKSAAAGKFLNEEEYEFGNPQFKENMSLDRESQQRSLAIHWWRKEIARRRYGPFNDMRAIVIAPKRDSIVRVIEAGGGQIVNAKPPFDETVHATHCLVELKSITDWDPYEFLAQRGVICINTLYVSNFLFTPKGSEIKDAILPHLSHFYS